MENLKGSGAVAPIITRDDIDTVILKFINERGEDDNSLRGKQFILPTKINNILKYKVWFKVEKSYNYRSINANLLKILDFISKEQNIILTQNRNGYKQQVLFIEFTDVDTEKLLTRAKHYNLTPTFYFNSKSTWKTHLIFCYVLTEVVTDRNFIHSLRFHLVNNIFRGYHADFKDYGYYSSMYCDSISNINISDTLYVPNKGGLTNE